VILSCLLSQVGTYDLGGKVITLESGSEGWLLHLRKHQSKKLYY